MSKGYNNKSISELEKDRIYAVTSIKKIFNQFGERVVLELDYEFDVFLPQKVIDFLLEDEKFYESFSENIRNFKVGMEHLGDFEIRFTNLPQICSDFMKSDEFAQFKSKYL